MSAKTKTSVKNKKVTAKKSAPKKVVTKKTVTKKPLVKSTSKSKPVAVKKTSIKAKSPVKKIVAKKAVTTKKVVKKATPKKAIVGKKVAPKKVVSKTSAIKLKKVIKPVTKTKVLLKKTVKPVAKTKPLVKKTVKPSATKKALVTPPKKDKVLKSVVVKPITTTVIKQEKVIKTKKEKAPPIKKTIIAPTTFRKEETTSPTANKVVKEPAGKFEMEFVIRASEDMVFEFVSTESGLSEWFCDDVNIRNGIFTFTWDGQQQEAKLVKEIPPVYIRYQWLDKNDGSYFEFRIQKDELTNDISLIITDFAPDKAEEESARLLWHSQVDKLLHVLGSFF